MAWALSKDLVSKIDAVKEQLGWEVEDLRNAWEEKSERWRDGDTGQEVSAWIESLESVIESLEEIETKS